MQTVHVIQDLPQPVAYLAEHENLALGWSIDCPRTCAVRWSPTSRRSTPGRTSRP